MSIITPQQKASEELMLKVLKRIEVARIEHPVSYDQLADEFQIPWRRVPSIVEKLRDFGYKIGTSNQDPPGAFLARTPDELMPSIHRMRDQAKKILARCNRMADWNSEEPTLFEQVIEAPDMSVGESAGETT